MELDQTMEIGFSNLFLQYFRYISILWRRSKFSSVLAESTNTFVRNYIILVDMAQTQLRNKSYYLSPNSHFSFYNVVRCPKPSV